MNRRCWEYISRDRKYYDEDKYSKHTFLEILNLHGSEGWELVSVDNDTAYLKKEYWKKAEE